jgi:hypothetical protein
MKFPGYECAVCGALKRDANHWWLLWVTDFMQSNGVQSDLSIGQWSEDRLAEHFTFFLKTVSLGNAVVACGNNCCQKLVERFLITRSLDAPCGAAGNPVEAKQ